MDRYHLNQLVSNLIESFILIQRGFASLDAEKAKEMYDPTEIMINLKDKGYGKTKDEQDFIVEFIENFITGFVHVRKGETV